MKLDVTIVAGVLLTLAGAALLIVWLNRSGPLERAEEAAKLERLLKQRFTHIQAVGHADRIGSAAYNLALSARRADAVKAYLVESAVEPAAIDTEGAAQRRRLRGAGGGGTPQHPARRMPAG